MLLLAIVCWGLRSSGILRTTEWWNFGVLKMESIVCTKTSIINCHSTLRNVPEERRYHLHRGTSLKSLKIKDASLMWAPPPQVLIKFRQNSPSDSRIETYVCAPRRMARHDDLYIYALSVMTLMFILFHHFLWCLFSGIQYLWINKLARNYVCNQLDKKSPQSVGQLAVVCNYMSLNLSKRAVRRWQSAAVLNRKDCCVEHKVSHKVERNVL